MAGRADATRLSRLVRVQGKLVNKLAEVTAEIDHLVHFPRQAVLKVPADPRVKAFLLWFQIEYKARRAGADYCISWGKHGALVKEMLGATTFERLQTLAKILLSEKTDDEFISQTDRGVEILKAKFNWLSDRLADWEARQRRPQ